MGFTGIFEGAIVPAVTVCSFNILRTLKVLAMGDAGDILSLKNPRYQKTRGEI